ncbi:carboxypeptidase regulatory-like domain-containing protein [Ramlibacter ginsenosidimutans]|uniref:Carboxypeptidase regulatory-like domain-containing protein n=1 Tax=Ramlibacter ginsenosidimutans TaxID=502333 RepID=A0A934TX56_9BURK|nr:carboxypeptidase regulatory-like domain-containing protein [Ramlibacter ginsenosidimutans]MBK6009299.1 carboxypeptidase regulatory-like domain-containing protein [Ramlibacter ginsenosidimutans]
MNARWFSLAMGPALLLAAAVPALAAGHEAGFRCGGIGESEQASIKQEAPRHDALLTFATRGGAYLAGVDFTVTSSDGNVVLQGTCDGPLMLLDVPRAGSYRVQASYNGHAQTKTVRMGEHTARMSFLWDAS